MDPGAGASATLRKRALSIDTAAAAAIELGSKEPAGGGREGEGVGADNSVGEEEPVSPTGRLFREPHFRCHIVAVFGLAAPVDLPALRAGVAATLARHPRFCSVQVRVCMHARSLLTHHHPSVPRVPLIHQLFVMRDIFAARLTYQRRRLGKPWPSSFFTLPFLFFVVSSLARLFNKLSSFCKIVRF